MSNEIEQEVFQARLACIKTAAGRGFNLDSADVPGWIRLGVAKLRAGGEITPQVLQEIDTSETTKLPE